MNRQWVPPRNINYGSKQALVETFYHLIEHQLTIFLGGMGPLNGGFGVSSGIMHA